MNRGRILLLVLLPLSFFCFDIYDFFSIPPPKPSNSSYPLIFHPHHHPPHSNSSDLTNRTYPATLNQKELANLNPKELARWNQTQIASLNHTQLAMLNRTQLATLKITLNDTILIKFASLCSYRGTSMSIKLLVLNNYPGINVTLLHHSPARPKYIASKLISTAQILIIMLVMAGKHIFLELKRPIPSWYFRLTAHKFFVIAIPWLLGCITINYLQNTESFEMFFNDELVFCKQMAGRFPSAVEVKEIILSCLDG